MIGRVVRGHRVGGLLHYLFGPGRHHEHHDQRVVASWDGIPGLHQPDQHGDGRFDLAALVAALTGPALAAGIDLGERERAGGRGLVWHCSMRTAPGDPVLTDEQWERIARDVLHRTGIAPLDDDGACRWVAVRHAVDHIHIAAVLVRSDTGRVVSPHLDYHRVRDAALAAEAEHGLVPTSPIDRTATPATTRAETEKAGRAGRGEASRDRLRRVVRHAAAHAQNLDEFAAAVTDDRLTALRWRHDRHGHRIGYAVADRRDHTHRAGDALVWFSGGALGADLTLPRLATRLAAHSPTTDTTDIVAGEVGEGGRPRWRQAWQDATRLAHLDPTDSAVVGDGDGDVDEAWAGIAQATGDLLIVVAAGLEFDPGPLTRAADRFAPATRLPDPRDREIRLTRHAHALRQASRMIARAGAVPTRSPRAAPVVLALVLTLAALVLQVAAWHDRHHRIAAARHARETHTALTDYAATLPTTTSLAAAASPRPARALPRARPHPVPTRFTAPRAPGR